MGCGATKIAQSEEETGQSFANVNEMMRWLELYGVQTAAWGQTATEKFSKTPEDLFAEIQSGEAVLRLVQQRRSLPATSCVVQRRIRAAKVRAQFFLEYGQRDRLLNVNKSCGCACNQVRVRHAKAPKAHLEESVQKFPNGQERPRNDLLSRKIRGNEEVRDVFVSAVLKEIGDDIHCEPKVAAIKIDESTAKRHPDEKGDSSSFPGLQTVYELHEVDAIVSDLPMSSFWSRENHDDGSLRVTHVFEWHPTVEYHENLTLNSDEMKIIQRLYRGYQSVNVKKLQGGFSGSLVLMINAVDMKCQEIEPTIVKLDRESDLRIEVDRTHEMIKYIGSSVTAIARPAEYENSRGGIALDVAGACWVLPQFFIHSDKEFDLVRTFRMILLQQFGLPPADSSHQCQPAAKNLSAEENVSQHIVNELWGPGGSLYRLAKQTVQRSSMDFIWTIDGILSKIADKISSALVPVCRVGSTEPGKVHEHYKKVVPHQLQAQLDAYKAKSVEIDIDTRQRRFQQSFIHNCPAHLLSNEQMMTFVYLFEHLSRLKDDMPDWLLNWRQLYWHRHGDLHGANVLVDLKDTSWLIDFAESSVGSAFDDCSKLCASILLQYQFAEGNGTDSDRLKLATAVVDAFVLTDDIDIWDSDTRLNSLPADAPEAARRALSLLNAILVKQCKLVRSCHCFQDTDLHPLNFNLPLLIQALKMLCYVDTRSWQKQIAWYLCVRLAKLLCKQLTQAPRKPPPLDVDQTPQLRLAQGPLWFCLRSKQNHVPDVPADYDWTVCRVQTPIFKSHAHETGDLSCKLMTLIGQERCQPVHFDDLCHICASNGASKAWSPGMAAQFEAVLKSMTELQKTQMLEQDDLVDLHELNLPPSLLSSIESSVIYTEATDPLLKPSKIIPLINKWAAEQLKECDTCEMRFYGKGQLVSVFLDSKWRDVEITQVAEITPTASAMISGATHLVRLTGDIKSVCGVVFNFYNHAPLVLKCDEFEFQRKHYETSVSTAHAFIVDALSGRRLDVFEQCVPIKMSVQKTAMDNGAKHIREVKSLSDFLHDQVAVCRCMPVSSDRPCLSFLILGGPACGKTSMASQLTMHAFTRSELIPINIKVVDLQQKRDVEEHANVFAKSWNWIDAFIQIQYGFGSKRSMFLRQAVASRRALIILDGIDEGGANKDSIQEHVVQVLSAQGHPLVVTSRPAGLNVQMFKSFHKIEMKFLDDGQQKMIVSNRLHMAKRSAQLESLIRYIHENMPKDRTTGERATGNPLILSMVLCIHETRPSVDAMPKHEVVLYQMASETMLNHVEKKHRAAGASSRTEQGSGNLTLRLFLENLALVSHSVDGKRRITVKDVDSTLKLAKNTDLAGSFSSSWESIKKQLESGRIPLLTLLQRQPLEFQFSHLSFQEYFAACAVCRGVALSAEASPWHWSQNSWWDNVLRFGQGFGREFDSGLLQAAGLTTQRNSATVNLTGDSNITSAIVEELRKLCPHITFTYCGV